MIEDSSKNLGESADFIERIVFPSGSIAPAKNLHEGCMVCRQDID